MDIIISEARETAGGPSSKYRDYADLGCREILDQRFLSYLDKKIDKKMNLLYDETQ